MAWTFRWYVPLALLAALLCVATVIVAGAGAPTDTGNGSPADDGVLETDGNWTVEDGEVLEYENVTILVNGNLTVSFGGQLSLANSRLLMNLSYDLQYWVRVDTGGELVLSDHDGDPTTGGDRSVLRSRDQIETFTVTLSKGSTVSVLRSRVADLGGVKGLDVGTAGLLFEDSELEHFTSMFVAEEGPVFRRSSITGDLTSSLYFLNSSATIEDCQIINCFYALNARGTPSPSVTNTTVANSFYPVNLEGASLTMRGGLLESSEYGMDLRLNQSSTAVLVDVEFSEDKVELIDDASSLEVRWTLTLTATDQEVEPLVGADVEANDTLGGTVFTGVTDDTGTVAIEVVDYVLSDAGRDGRNPHSVRISLDRYHSRFSINVTETMFREVTVMTNLKPVVVVTSPVPDIRVVQNQPVVLDASPSYDPNGDPLTFTWTADVGDRQLYSGPSPTAEAGLLFGDSAIILRVSDGLGGVNVTTIPVTVLQRMQATVEVDEDAFDAELVAEYGGDGTVNMTEAPMSPPYARELLGVFLTVFAGGDAVLASGELVIGYSTDLIPFGMDEATVRIAKEDGGIWTVVPGSSVDVVGHTATATIASFGLYGLMGVMPDNIPPRLRMDLDGTMVVPYDVEVEVGGEVDVQVVVEDELPAFAMLSVDWLPGFLHLDGTTKRIWGTAPDLPGIYLLNMTVTDIGGLTDSASIHLTVTGTAEPPQLWNMISEPKSGDEDTIFEVRVRYVSPRNQAPEYVRMYYDNESFQMFPVEEGDKDYRGGVVYSTKLRLPEGTNRLYFETSDGLAVNTTDEALEVRVEGVSFKPTNLELAVILVAFVAIVLGLAIIHMTSERYNRLKDAHLGKDREDRIDYIRPEPKEKGGEDEAPEGEAEEEGEKEGKEEGEEERNGDEEGEGEDDASSSEAGPAGPRSGRRVEEVAPAEDDEEMEHKVERLEEELSELNGEIDDEEEGLERIDDEIEEIIDELEDDEERSSGV